MWVIKTTGEKEKFQPGKIKKTCLKAGASLELADEIVERVKKRVFNGISTRKVLELVLKNLERKKPIVATRYNLKEAIVRLGPSGFAFEKLVQEILQAHSYKVKMPEILYGACVGHEIDLIAQKEKCYLVECKYHNYSGIYSGIKDILYTYARFLDLKEGFEKNKCPINFDKPFLICNTKFSEDAIQYALCRDIKIMAWNYPQGAGLRELLEKKGLYPVTILRTINKIIYKKLVKNGLMLCRDLVKKDFKTLKKITGLKDKEITRLLREAKNIVKIN